MSYEWLSTVTQLQGNQKKKNYYINIHVVFSILFAASLFTSIHC